jgi:hypothetical protein
MLLGCCHCGQEESVPSFVPPSVDTPSLLNPSESATSIFGTGPGFCGACYNLPGRWKVGTKGDWWVWNPNFNLAQVDDCPTVPTYVYHTLYNQETTGIYSGLTYNAWSTLGRYNDADRDNPCAVWKTITKAVELSSNPCGNSPPLYMPCGPNTYNIPLMELAAFNGPGTANNTTVFYLFYWWSICSLASMSEGTAIGYHWKWIVHRQTPPYSISCVRTFGAEMIGSAGYDLFGSPYILSTADTSWGTVAVEPA